LGHHRAFAAARLALYTRDLMLADVRQQLRPVLFDRQYLALLVLVLVLVLVLLLPLLVLVLVLLLLLVLVLVLVLLLLLLLLLLLYRRIVVDVQVL
jgi:hypothetical protein